MLQEGKLDEVRMLQKQLNDFEQHMAAEEAAQAVRASKEARRQALQQAKKTSEPAPTPAPAPPPALVRSASLSQRPSFTAPAPAAAIPTPVAAAAVPMPAAAPVLARSASLAQRPTPPASAPRPVVQETFGSEPASASLRELLFAPSQPRPVARTQSSSSAAPVVETAAPAGPPAISAPVSAAVALRSFTPPLLAQAQAPALAPALAIASNPIAARWAGDTVSTSSSVVEAARPARAILAEQRANLLDLMRVARKVKSVCVFDNHFFEFYRR